MCVELLGAVSTKPKKYWDSVCDRLGYGLFCACAATSARSWIKLYTLFDIYKLGIHIQSFTIRHIHIQSFTIRCGSVACDEL